MAQKNVTLSQFCLHSLAEPLSRFMVPLMAAQENNVFFIIW